MSGLDLSHLPTEVVDAFENYEPRDNVDAYRRNRAFIVETVSRACPPSPGSAKDSLRAMHVLVVDCEDQGIAISLPTTLYAEGVETLASRLRARAGDGTDLIDNQISRLRSLGRLLNPTSNWPVKRCTGRKRSLLPPYPPSQEAALLRSALQIKGPRQRRIALGALGMGCGAGLTGGEQHRAKTTDPYQDSNGNWWIQVRDTSGAVCRIVPLADPWGGIIRQAVAIPDESEYAEWILPLGRNHNAFATNLKALTLGNGAPALQAARLRTTWMVQRLQSGAWPTTVQHFAGLTSLETVMQACEFLPRQTDDAGLRVMSAKFEVSP
jgi:hypothetical protein